MKKTLLTLSAVLLLTGCAELTNESSSTSMKSCMTSEAIAKVQNGSAFTGTVKSNAQTIAKTCAKRMALDASGISDADVNLATNLLNAYMAAKQ